MAISGGKTTRHVLHTARTLSLLSLSLLVGFALALATQQITYNITPNSGPGTVTISPMSLGDVQEGTSGTRLFTDTITIRLTQPGTWTLHLSMLPTTAHFTSLTLTLTNGGGNTGLSLTLAQPTGTLNIDGPQTIALSLSVTFTIPQGVTNSVDSTPGTIGLEAWIT